MVNSETSQAGDRPLPSGSLPVGRADARESAETGDELLQLQQLLLGDRLETMANVNAEAIAEVLPQAILQARAQQERLTLASVLTVESAIRASVDRDINVLSEALFPVIGPAARKAIATAIDNLVQSFDRALEYSLSPQSFKWRLEALQTGQSFAEIVLLRTLVYQVEQVLLIHKETGLVLQHAIGTAVTTQDPDMVSAMLTAIQDFVRDSFSVSSSEGLDTLELGDLNLWLEEGPQAILACVIRGTAPHEFRETLRENLEKIHLLFGQQLHAFDGDQTTLADSHPYLESCLEAQFKSQQSETSPAKKRRQVLGWVLLGAIAIGFIAKVAIDYRSHRRWLNYVERIDKQPGIVVINTQRKRGKFHLEGLRDPLAVDPTQLLSAARLDPDSVQMNWEPYISTSPDFLEARTQALLDPPPTANLALDRDRQVLRISGSAPEGWIQQARRLSQHLGLSGLDETQLVSTERQLIRELTDRIEARQLDFVPQGTRLPEPSQAVLQQQASDLIQIIAAAQRLGKDARVILTGYSDRGVPVWKALGQARSEAARHVLAHRGIDTELTIVRASPESQATDSPGRAAVRFMVQLQDSDLE